VTLGDADERIVKVVAPLLMVHGTEDRSAPFASVVRLYALANQPQQFVRLDGAGHLALELVIPQVLEWIDETLQ
jgi:uncharacterized protein